MWSEHEEFNCAQRAHQNTLESLPFFIINLIFAVIWYHVEAASFGLVFLVARVIYTVGYIHFGPKWRIPGVVLTVFGSILPLVGLNIASAGVFLGFNKKFEE